MKEMLKTWFPMLRPALLSIVLLDGKHLRCALMLMRLREEFGLVEVEGAAKR
jgi:hypothetical protein